jgi:tRNA(adenine34) deaminase
MIISFPSIKIGMMILTENDFNFMRIAIEEAEIAYEKGDVPVGAVLVQNNVVIARAHNCRESCNDPTGHAETIALRFGAHKKSTWRLTHATLYVTKEPCIMCAGAMINARLGHLVYGCRDEKGGAVESLYRILSDERLNHKVEVVSGVLQEECAGMLKKFFQERR